MESTIDYLRRKLKEAGPGAWEDIARTVNEGLDEAHHVTFHTLRKIAYGERPNLGMVKGDALKGYFVSREAKAF